MFRYNSIRFGGIRYYCNNNTNANNAESSKEVPKKLRKEKSMKSFSKFVETKHKSYNEHHPREKSDEDVRNRSNIKL